MPGLSVTVAEQIEALREVAGDAAVALIRREPDATIARIVAGWPRRSTRPVPTRSASAPSRRFTEIIDVYVEDELGGVPAP